MTGSLKIKNGIYYVVINYKDNYGKYKQKKIFWRQTKIKRCNLSSFLFADFLQNNTIRQNAILHDIYRVSCKFFVQIRDKFVEIAHFLVFLPKIM